MRKIPEYGFRPTSFHVFMGGIQVGTQAEKRTTVFSIAIRPLRGASDRKAPTSGGGYLL